LAPSAHGFGRRVGTGNLTTDNNSALASGISIFKRHKQYRHDYQTRYRRGLGLARRRGGFECDVDHAKQRDFVFGCQRRPHGQQRGTMLITAVGGTTLSLSGA